MEYYSALKKGNSDTGYHVDEPYRHCAKWIIQSQENKHRTIPLTRGPRIVKFTETESKKDEARAWERGRGSCLMGRVSLG